MEEQDERVLESLQSAVDDIKEIIEIFGEEDGDLHEARMFLEHDLLELTTDEFKGLKERFYKADAILDKAITKYERLYTDINHSIKRIKGKEVSALISDEDLGQHASEIKSHLESACSDVAHDQFQMWEKGINLGPEGIDIKFENAKKDGVTDLQGWYADEIYNDVDTCSDLTGDRIHDAAKGNEIVMVAIATKIKESSHPALKKAMDNFIARHEKG